MDYWQFDDIGKQPLSLDGFEDRTIVRTEAVSPYVLGAVYWEREFYHLWIHLAHHNGVKGATAVWDHISGGKSLEMNVVEMVTQGYYPNYHDEPDIRVQYLTLAKEITAQKHNEQDFISLKSFDVMEAHYGDLRSRLGQTEPDFTLLFRATDTEEERYHTLFQHLMCRTFVPYLHDWMPQLWRWLRYTKQILETKSFGPYIGWRVKLNEADILEYVIREVRAGRFSLGAETELALAA